MNFFSNIIDTSLSVAKVIINARHYTKSITSNDDCCIILGNGPSLKRALEDDFEKIARQTLFCVNGFAHSPYFVQLRPSYYILHDPSFWKSSSDLVSSIFDQISAKTAWPLLVMLPHHAKKSSAIKSLTNNPNIKLHFYNYTVYKGFQTLGNIFYNLNLAMPQSQNVLVAALFQSIKIGFKKVILLGADHTWHQQLMVDRNNVLCIQDTHFYENKASITYKPYYKTPDSKETFRIAEILELYVKVFLGYSNIQKFAANKGTKVYNASEVSFIDEFERIKL